MVRAPRISSSPHSPPEKMGLRSSRRLAGRACACHRCQVKTLDIVCAAALAALAAGCSGDKECTLVGCSDGFSVTALASEGLRDGSYEVQLMLDGEAVTCSHPQLVAAPQSSGTCTAAGVRSDLLIHNGGAPETESANALAIDIPGTPSQVELRVLHDGQLIGEASYAPTYEALMPNGPECGPLCNRAPPQQLSLVFE